MWHLIIEVTDERAIGSFAYPLRKVGPRCNKIREKYDESLVNTFFFCFFLTNFPRRLFLGFLHLNLTEKAINFRESI